MKGTSPSDRTKTDFCKIERKQIKLNQSQSMFNVCSWCLWPKLVVGDTPLGNNSIPAPRICHLSSADLHDIAIYSPMNMLTVFRLRSRQPECEAKQWEIHHIDWNVLKTI